MQKKLAPAQFFIFSKRGPMKKKLLNQNGQGVMEYVIISSLIGIFCLMAVKQFGQVIQTRVNSMKEEIVRNIDIK